MLWQTFPAKLWPSFLKIQPTVLIFEELAILASGGSIPTIFSSQLGSSCGTQQRHSFELCGTEERNQSTQRWSPKGMECPENITLSSAEKKQGVGHSSYCLSAQKTSPVPIFCRKQKTKRHFKMSFEKDKQKRKQNGGASNSRTHLIFLCLIPIEERCLFQSNIPSEVTLLCHLWSAWLLNITEDGSVPQIKYHVDTFSWSDCPPGTSSGPLSHNPTWRQFDLKGNWTYSPPHRHQVSPLQPQRGEAAKAPKPPPH